MAMNGTALGSAIVTALEAQFSTVIAAEFRPAWGVIANEIVDHITANADIQIKDAFTTGTPIATDGGAALKTAWSSQADLAGGIK